jgi:hypothetical protein
MHISFALLFVSLLPLALADDQDVGASIVAGVALFVILGCGLLIALCRCLRYICCGSSTQNVTVVTNHAPPPAYTSIP